MGQSTSGPILPVFTSAHAARNATASSVFAPPPGAALPARRVESPPAACGEESVGGAMDEFAALLPLSAEVDEGPLGAHMERLRFHLRSSLATLFAPLALDAPVADAAAGEAAALSTALPSPHGSTVVAELSISNLREVHSCVHSMLAAVQQQLALRLRAEPHTPRR